jgi:hypothetical protein
MLVVHAAAEDAYRSFRSFHGRPANPDYTEDCSYLLWHMGRYLQGHGYSIYAGGVEGHVDTAIDLTDPRGGGPH